MLDCSVVPSVMTIWRSLGKGPLANDRCEYELGNAESGKMLSYQLLSVSSFLEAFVRSTVASFSTADEDGFIRDTGEPVRFSHLWPPMGRSSVVHRPLLPPPFPRPRPPPVVLDGGAGTLLHCCPLWFCARHLLHACTRELFLLQNPPTVCLQEPEQKPQHNGVPLRLVVNKPFVTLCCFSPLSLATFCLFTGGSGGKTCC